MNNFNLQLLIALILIKMESIIFWFNQSEMKCPIEIKLMGIDYSEYLAGVFL
jgi:hypothetical protein